MSTLKRFFKDTIIYGIAAVLPRAINILLVKIHTSVFGAERYAVNTDYYVYAAYLNALLTYGLETAFFRFFTKEKEKGKVISTTFIALLSTSLLFLVIAFFNAAHIASYFNFEKVSYVQILILTAFFDTIVVIPFAYLRVNNKPIRFAGIKIANILIYAFLNVFFLVLIPKGYVPKTVVPTSLHFFNAGSPQVIYIFIANVIASIATLVMLFPIILKIKWQFDSAILKKLLAYGLPIMVASLAFVTNENIDKLLLKNLVGNKDMGVYAACYKLGVFMSIYIMAFRLGAEPFFFNQAKQKGAQEKYALILKWFTVLGALFMLIVIVYIDVFAQVLLGKKEYFDALAIVPIVLLANLCLGIYNNLSIWYKLTDKTRYGMFISIFGALITIVFNLIMIPKIGYMASAWATLITYALMMVVSYSLGKRHYPVPYKTLRIVSYVCIAIGLSLISFTFFRQNYIVSTACVLLFLSSIYVFDKKELIALIKR